MEKKKKSKKWIITLIVITAIVIVAAIFVFWYFFAGQTNYDVFKKPVENTTSAQSNTENTSDSTQGITEKQTEDETAATVDKGETGLYSITQDNNGYDIYAYTTLPVNFDNMKEINSDLYAWIYFPDTQIDNPIAQYSGDDDSYYLTHDVYGNYSIYGTIYTEKCNSKDFSDPNTLIYGHEMLNGSMFQNLHYYEDSSYFEHNPYFYIFEENRVLTYEVYSAFTFDNRHLMYAFDFTNKDEYQSFLDIAANPGNGNVRKDMQVTTDDKIVTLSTCDGNNSDARYLVVGVLINDYTTAQ